MEASQLLLTVGQVAGIGGVALGVLLLVFRDVVRRNIFPRLAQNQAYRVITLVVILTFAISALGLVVWGYVQTRPRQETATVAFPSSNPEPIMRAHLSLVDEGRYAEAYEQASREAKKRFQRDFFVNAFESQRKPQGNPLSRHVYGASTLRELPDRTPGAFAVGTFITEFERGGRFLESVTLIAEDGAWKILFHQIAPCHPQLCPPK